MKKNGIGLEILSGYMLNLPKQRLEAEFKHRAKSVRKALEEELTRRRQGQTPVTATSK